MRCRNCGREIPDGMLRCEYCGEELCIVPDYNPLDDVLAAQVKGSIDGTETPLDDYEYMNRTASLRRSTGSMARAGRNTVVKRNTVVSRNTAVKRNTSSNMNKDNAANGRRNTAPGGRRNTASGGRRNTSSGTGRNAGNDRKRQAERKRALRKKKLLRALIILLIIAVVLGVLGFVLYQNSYAGQVKKGYKALSEQQYSDAEHYFNKAVKKAPEKAEAYIGLAKICLADNDRDGAEEIYRDAIDKYPESTAIYEACIKFYLETSQNKEIPILLDEAKDSVRESLSEYIVKVPEFSLDDSETFDDVQQLSLTAKSGDIYYTTDGTEPTEKSKKYDEPIQISEGETTIKAIAVNKKGVPSLTEIKTYTVELPIEDAPAVTPSTGQYDEPVQITIQVPDGYTAYYTMDRSDPTTESNLYTGPIEMPAGSTIFKAVLVNGKGRLSGVTTRNYELTIQ